MSTGTSADQRGPSGAAPKGSAWRGWVVFAATMMALLGVYHAFAGLVALFEDEYYLVGESDLVVNVDFTAWGWTHLIIGALLILAAFALVQGATWARVVTIVVAGLSAIVNLAFLSAYPLWGVIMITLDLLVIYAVTTHGGRASMQSLQRS
jgi:hypothetical protein